MSRAQQPEIEACPFCGEKQDNFSIQLGEFTRGKNGQDNR